MSSSKLLIVIAQLNLGVGDIQGNTNKIIAAITKANKELNADIILFPELSICSYPPEDLLLRPAFHDAVQHAVNKIVKKTKESYVLLGHPQKKGRHVYNACSLIHQQRVIHTYFKQNLPNYGVFDEKRYFKEGHKPCFFEINGHKAAISLCEDIWVSESVDQAVAAGSNIMFNMNASPYHKDKLAVREKLLTRQARQANMHIVYTNLVGGQDDLVFDGNSMVIDNKGECIFHAPPFVEGLFEVDLDLEKKNWPCQINHLTEEQGIYKALVLGTQDYITKNKFSGAIIGLSGGIDSALTLCIAVDALGAENVEVLIMPSRYTAEISIEDAVQQAKGLKVNYDILSIEPVFNNFLDLLSPRFKDLPVDITEENIQARCRGLLLMAVSNKSGKLVLTTGNKSEMAVGYATLYGDMAGGFAPLKDVWKTMVYRLAKWRNKGHEVIPQRIITRPPTAELRLDQRDQDSLPDYATLDPILELYIEKDTPPETIIGNGFKAKDVYSVINMVDKNEYKRRQAAIGIRITERAFGRDRRYPITSAYVEKG